MPIPAKTYIPGGAEKVQAACDFVTKHGSTIIAVTGIISPSDEVLIAGAITGIQSACAIFERVLRIYDPHFQDDKSYIDQ